jgi:hypothetical protein
MVSHYILPFLYLFFLVGRKGKMKERERKSERKSERKKGKKHRLMRGLGLSIVSQPQVFIFFMVRRKLGLLY